MKATPSFLWLPLLAVMLTGCGSDNAAPPQMPPAAVSVISVVDQPVGSYSEFVGRTEAINEVEIRARVEGFLVQRNFNEGSMVEKDQLLFEIDRAPFLATLKGAQAQLASAQANLANVRKNFIRSKDLVKTGAISQSDFDSQQSAELMAVAQVESAKANLQTAQLNLGYTRIEAPFEGEVGKSTYSVGNLVSPSSQPLATLTSMNPMYVMFQVDERELIAHLQNGARGTDAASIEQRNAYNLTLRLSNGAEYNQPGVFSFADTQVNESMGTLTLRASFPNPDKVLLPGMYVTLQAESKKKEMMPLIPQAAVQQDQSGHFVLVVTAQNMVETRPVELGRRVGAMWAVQAGLRPNEHIIVEGLQKVRPGATVNPTLVVVDPKTGTIAKAGLAH